MSKRRGEKKLSRRTTINWFDFPYELRAMIIDEMGPKSRCRFAICSKLCEKEAKESKFYLRGITLKRNQIVVSHSNFQNYCLDFIEIDNITVPQTFVIYKTTAKFMTRHVAQMTARVIKWTKQETGTADDVRIRYLNRYFTDYKRSITNITIEDTRFPFDRFNIKQMERFTKIIDDENDILDKGFVSLTQLLRSDHVNLKRTKMNFDQIVQFGGIDLAIRCNEFDKECISKYLKMWKNGELSKTIDSLNVFVESNGLNITEEDISQDLDHFQYKLGTGDDESFRFKFLANHQINSVYHSRVFCMYRQQTRLFHFVVYNCDTPLRSDSSSSDEENNEHPDIVWDSDA